MSAASITSEVAGRFHGLRRAYLFSQVAISVLAASCLWGLIWVALAAADYHFELPLKTRNGLMIGLSAVVVLWLLVRVFRVGRRVNESSFAEHLETRFSDFGQRIRTVLDTVNGKVTGPDEMLSALGHQTMGRWETLSPEQLLPRRSLSAALLAAIAVACVCAALLFRGGDWTTAMNRAIGGSQTYTQLSVTPGNDRLLEGKMIDVSLTLTGRTNRNVAVRHRTVKPASKDPMPSSDSPVDDWVEMSLIGKAASDTGDETETEAREVTFDVSLGRARQTVEYQFLTSVGDSQIHRIDVQPLIKAVEVATLVTPPEYTRLNQRRFSTRKVTVLEGSEVLVTVRTNHPLATAKLEVTTRAKSASKTPDKIALPAGDNPNVWQFALSSDVASNWKLSGNGPDGTPMTAVKGRITIRKDSAPGISFRDPAENLEVHTLAEVPMAIQVSDDYGLQECGIVFELGDEGEFVLTDWIFEGDSTVKGNTTKKRLSEILPLESFELTEKDFISYYAYAIDNKESGPQRTESDIRYIDIRQLRQFYQERDLPPPGGGPPGGSGLRPTLEQIIRRERFLVNRTRRLTRTAQSDLDSQLGTIERMVENQSDLAGLVRILTNFLVEQGNDDVSVLNQAEALMLQASDSLAAANFNLALIQQNDALLALAEARRTLEQTLSKRMTRRQRQQMARFNQRLQQKLRRERPKSDMQLADSLEQIAKDQLQLGLSVAMQQSRSATPTQADDTNTKSLEDQPGLPNVEAGESEGDVAEEPEAEEPEAEEPEAEEPEAEESEAEESEAEEPEAEQPAGDDIADDDTADAPQDPEDAMQEPTVYERQVELLERFQAISGELQTRDDLSDLFLSRIAALSEELDQLTSMIPNQQDETVMPDDSRFVRSSMNAASALSELSLHLKALQPGEAVQRIGKLRDFTRQQSGFEHALSLKTDQMAESAMNGSTSDHRPVSVDASQVASQAVARAMTIEDVLQMPVEMGDVETSEVNDVLRAFTEETEFDLLLMESRDADSEIADADRATINSEESGEALKRAIEYAEIAAVLDDLYNELVAPRLKKLRALERRASQLQLGGGGGGQPQPKSQPKPKPQDEKQPKMDKAEKKAAMEELKKELQAAGLKELAKLLDGNQTSNQQIQEMASSTNMSGQSAVSTNLEDLMKTDAIRLQLVVKKLRDQIQQAILLEISADRNAAVPAEYEKLVDGYFRSLAEGATE